MRKAGAHAVGAGRAARDRRIAMEKRVGGCQRQRLPVRVWRQAALDLVASFEIRAVHPQQFRGDERASRDGGQRLRPVPQLDRAAPLPDSEPQEMMRGLLWKRPGVGHRPLPDHAQRQHHRRRMRVADAPAKEIGRSFELVEKIGRIGAMKITQRHPTGVTAHDRRTRNGRGVGIEVERVFQQVAQTVADRVRRRPADRAAFALPATQGKADVNNTPHPG